MTQLQGCADTAASKQETGKAAVSGFTVDDKDKDGKSHSKASRKGIKS